MDLQENTTAEKVVLQQLGTSVEDDGASQDISDSQDFRAAAESDENAEVRSNPKKNSSRGASHKRGQWKCYCLCCSKQTESSTSQSADVPVKRDYVSKSDVDVQEIQAVSYDDMMAVKGFAVAVVQACVKHDYYGLCYWHQMNDPQQDAHECLHYAYRDPVIHYICSLLDPYKVYKLLRVVYGLSAEKKYVHPDILKILTVTLEEVQLAHHPGLKLLCMRGVCTANDRKMIERLVERRMCKLYLNNRRIGSLGPRRLF
ncbi:uncharacterized protein LOC144773766 [Lissotriton helveticus]